MKKNIEKDVETVLKMCTSMGHQIMNAKDQYHFDEFADILNLHHLDYLYLRERFRKALNECYIRGFCHKLRRDKPIGYDFTKYLSQLNKAKD